MREDTTVQSGVHDPPEVDDLNKIVGIGPGFEKRFHLAGIKTYAQFARLTLEEIAKILAGQAGFNIKRAVAQDWIGQARHLSEELKENGLEEEGGNAYEPQHYASYKLEFLLDKDNQVRRTRVFHIQSPNNNEDNWAGWDEARLRNFLLESAGLHLPEPSIPPAQTSIIPAPQPEQGVHVQPNIAHPGLKHHGAPLVRNVSLLSQGREAPGNIVEGSKPFEIRLDIDLSQAQAPAGETLGYEATIFVKQFGGRQRLPAGQSTGALARLESTQISIQGTPLAPGDYLLEALVAIWPLSQARHPESRQMACMEGVLLHVS